MAIDKNKPVSKLLVDGTELVLQPENMMTTDTNQDVSGKKKFLVDIELVGNLDFGDGAKILKDDQNRIAVKFNDTIKVKFGQNDTLFATRVTPDASNTYDLGRSGVYWRDLHLAGALKDGTHEIPIADIITANSISFKKIAVPSSTTLTDDEIDEIIIGCQINGNFLNLIRPTLFPAREIAGSVYRGVMIGYLTNGNAYIGMYEINKGTKVISQLAQTNNLVDLRSIANLYMGNYIINIDQFGQLQIGNANVNSIQFDGSTIRAQNIVPMANNQKDLGSSAMLWKDIHFSGDLKDGTNSASLADLIDTVIQLNTGTYTSGTDMSDEDYAQLSPLVSLTFEQIIAKKFRFEIQKSDRNETYSSRAYVIRKGGKSFTGDWYDIQIDLGSFGTIAISKAAIPNKKY